MAIRNAIIFGVGLADTPRKSLWPARLDWIQSASGLFIALFTWAWYPATAHPSRPPRFQSGSGRVVATDEQLMARRHTFAPAAP